MSLSALAVCVQAAGQSRADAQALVMRGDSLHLNYRFEQALEAYFMVPAAALDPENAARLEGKISRSQNALNMTEFCAKPHVVARQRFSRKDFFLFYPLKNQAWHPSPNPLDSIAGFPTYFPKGDSLVVYSAPDRSGSRSLYMTHNPDSAWRSPALLGENVLSTGSEVFPILSADGKTLYFASDGLYGMGGYDLYSSAWDSEYECWGEPVNLGFPFSSPSDDFLLVNTDDGKYTLFASNRDCSRDSVYIYVLEYGDELKREAVRDPELLRDLASLRPVEDPSRIDADSAVSEGIPGNDDTRLYMSKMASSRALRDSVYRREREVDLLREQLGRSREDATASITAAILEKEAELTPLREQLEQLNKDIRSIESAFLRSGVVEAGDMAEREVVGAALGYTFSKNSLGGRIKIRPPREESRPTFRVSPVGRFSQDNTLPAGLVYQIELFSQPRHASLDQIHGLSPVYERLGSNLRYTYLVGLFPSYNSALEQLNYIRKLGFPEARVAAFRDGRPLSVGAARKLEKR